MTDNVSHAGKPTPKVLTAPAHDAPLSEKIQYLYDLYNQARPAGRRELSDTEVAKQGTELTGKPISQNTIWKSRTGKNENPKRDTLTALSKVFGVGMAYWDDDEAAAQICRQLDMLYRLKGAGVTATAPDTFGAQAIEEIRRQLDQANKLRDAGIIGPHLSSLDDEPAERLREMVDLVDKLQVNGVTGAHLRALHKLSPRARKMVLDLLEQASQLDQ